MSLTLIVGDRGSGKTLLASILASMSNNDVYSNYRLRLKNWKLLSPEVIITLDKESTIIIDEAYIWLESRTSSKVINRYMSYILFQSRKRGIDIYIVMQLVSTVDLRFRELADYIIQCVNDKEKEKFVYTIQKRSQTTKYGNVVLELTYKNAEKYFDIYDTYEIVDPLDDELEDMAITDWSKYDDEIDSVAKELIKKKKNWTLAGIEDYCSSNGKGKKYAKRVYNRIKYLT